MFIPGDCSCQKQADGLVCFIKLHGVLQVTAPEIEGKEGGTMNSLAVRRLFLFWRALRVAGERIRSGYIGACLRFAEIVAAPLSLVLAAISPANAQTDIATLTQGWNNQVRGLASSVQYVSYLGGAGMVAWGIWKWMHRSQHSNEPASSAMKLVLGGVGLLGFGYVAGVFSQSALGVNATSGLGTLGINAGP